jgi:hypothetical protein
MRSFKTANEGSTASLNGGEGGEEGSEIDSASAYSFKTAEEVGNLKEEAEGLAQAALKEQAAAEGAHGDVVPQSAAEGANGDGIV